MKKESGKKKWIIIAVIIILLLIIAGIVIFFLMNKSSGFGFAGFDFSASSKALDSISEASNKNTFDNTKLNPFANSTG